MFNTTLAHHITGFCCWFNLRPPFGGLPYSILNSRCFVEVDEACLRLFCVNMLQSVARDCSEMNRREGHIS